MCLTSLPSPAALLNYLKSHFKIGIPRCCVQRRGPRKAQARNDTYTVYDNVCRCCEAKHCLQGSFFIQFYFGVEISLPFYGVLCSTPSKF